MGDLTEYRKILDKEKVKRELCLNDLIKNKEKMEDTLKLLSDYSMVRTIFQTVGRQTQSSLEYHISNIVTLALHSVFDNPPNFKVKFELRRNKTECDLLFEEQGQEYKPIDASGGGVLDIVSFALRIAFWSIRKNRNCLILDEPFRNVSPELQTRVSEMIKTISEKLGIQILMVSHAQDINQAADKTFICSKNKNISQLMESQNGKL